MSESIGLKTIYDLLGLNFFIPSYQRGYRWTEQQVRDLLQDILDFTTKDKEKGEFYCLQPIVIKCCEEETIKQHNLSSNLDDNIWYEVIDGQQRLTTIHIILSYFEEFLGEETLNTAYGREKFVIEYETRKETRQFLEKITQAYHNIDCEYIYQAYQTVKEWFQMQAQRKFVRDEMMKTFLVADVDKYPVQVIWYVLPARDNGSRTDAIDSFTRLNVGKIPLTNSELVKALFLQKRNFKDDEAELRQIEIAKEWDQIENALQNDEFWAFLNKSGNDSYVRIEFLFDMMYQVEKRKNTNADKNYGTDKYATFRYFSKKFSSNPTPKVVLAAWDEVKGYFAIFQDWYEDNEWYHYIGYLIWEGSSSIIDLYNEYADSSKSAFVDTLKNRVKKSLEKIRYTEEGGRYSLVNTYDSTKKGLLRTLFLIYNIEFILQKKATYYRFPFDLFKREKWDIEHVSSQTENLLKEKESQEEWLKTACESLQENEIEEYKEFENKSFDEKWKWIISKVGEDRIDDLKNSIGNLTLLNAEINRSYGNNIFPAKRKIIMKKDQEGAFIPICTKNVFLKYHTGGNNLRWSEQDILNSMHHIVEILKNYLAKSNE